MTDRPCKLDADMKRFWRMFLPGTPQPVCGTPEEMTDRPDGAESPADHPSRRREVQPRRD